MNNTLSKVIIFAAGAAIGSLVTWKVVKTKYEQIANKEINDVLERFSKDKEKVEEAVEEVVEEPVAESKNAEKKEQVNKYYDILEGASYKDCAEEKEKGGQVMTNRIYIIPPEEYDENGYDTVTLLYYEDEVVVDEKNYVVEEDELEDLIGDREVLSHFGEYEDDSVFVRNDLRKIDIEILSVEGPYYYED